MSSAAAPSADEIELQERAQRLDAVQEMWRDDFGWRNLALAGWALLAGIVVLDVFVFGLLGQSYVAWYLANGSILALAAPVLSGVGVDLDRRYGLISAHPLYYLSGWLFIVDDWWKIWEPATDGGRKYLQGTRSVAFDRLVSRLFSLVLRLALIAWFLVSAPPQYLLNLIAGAPARAALGSGMVVWDYQTFRHETSNGKTTNSFHQGTNVQDAQKPKPNPGSIRLGFDVKPVSVTYALSALLLFLITSALNR